MSTRPATSAGVNASGGTASPGASVKLPTSISEEDEADDSPLPELGGRISGELRWFGEIPVVRQGRTREEQRQLDLTLGRTCIHETSRRLRGHEW